MRRSIIILSLIAISLIYFILRLWWREYVIFGFDMPWLALSVQSFIERGTYLTAQSFVVDNSWGFPSWGIMQFYFLTPFLLLTKNPINLSVLFAIVNLLGLSAIIYIGWKYFSPLTGIISGLLLATHPWWVIFTQNLYQPSSTMVFICLSMLFAFLFLDNKEGVWLSLLIFFMAILINMYLETIPFVLTTIILVSVQGRILLKRIKYILFGVLGSLFVFFPAIKFYIEDPTQLFKFQKAYEIESTWDRLKIIAPSFFQILSGDKFQWQLGYAYGDFLKTFPPSLVINQILSAFLVMVLVHTIYKAVKIKEDRLFRIVLIAWTISPFWFLLIVPLLIRNFAPRYFILAIPSVVLLISIFIQDALGKLWRNNIFTKHPWWIFPIIISLYWSLFTFKYETFIKNYSYPHGRLGEADTPYIFIEKAVRWVIDDSEKKNYSGIVLSNYEDNAKDFSLWYETKWIWQYILKRDYKVAQNGNVGYYLILHSSILNEKKLNNYAQFGPFVAFENRNQ